MSLLVSYSKKPGNRSLVLRRAVPRDIPAMADLLNRTSAALYRPLLTDGEYRDPWYTPRQLQAELEPYDTAIVLDGRRIVGLSASAPIGINSVYIFLLFVALTHMQRGIGTWLFSEVIGKARELRRTEIVLQVHRRAVWALNAYFRLGFQVAACGEGEIRGWKDGLAAAKDIARESLLMVCPVSTAGAGCSREEARRLVAEYSTDSADGG